MSDFLAEASVLIRPDTTQFRAELVAQIAAATRSIPPIPVSIVADPRATAGLVAAQREAQSAALGLASTEQVLNSALGEQALLLDADTVATNANAVAAERAGVAAASSARQARVHAQQLGQVNKALVANAASLAGLRGATLAASIPFIAATVAVVAFGKAISVAARTQTELNTFRVVAGATAEEMERVSEAAQQLGQDIRLPAVSAADAAEAMTELAKAGLSVEDSIDAARGVLELAAAAQIDQAQAVEITAGALNSFGLQGREAVKVADLLAGASIAAQGSISDMGLALKQTEAVAKLVGLTLQDTVTFITLLAKNGLSASDAGTSLRVSLLRLVNPTAAAQKQIQQLGLEIRDAQGNVRPDVFAQFADATENLGKAQRDAAAAIIFGADGIRTASILAREGADGFNQAEDAISGMGIAADVSGARTKGFAGEVSGLQSNLETLGGTLGTLLLPALTEFVRTINLAVTSVNKLAGPLAHVQVAGVGVADVLKDIVASSNPIFFTFHRGGQAIDLFNRIIGRTDDEEEKATVAAKQLTSSFTDLADAAERASAGIQASFAAAGRALVEQRQRIEVQLGNVGENVLDAEIARNTARRRAALVKQAQTLRDAIAEQEKIVAGGGRGAATAQKFVRETLKPQLVATLNEIDAIDKQTLAEAKQKANEAKRHAKELADARLDAQRAVIDAVGSRVTARENAVLRASLTEGLRDDLRANLLLRNSIIAGINNVRDIVARTAAEAKQKAAAIASLSRELIGVLKTISDLRKEIADQRRQDAEEARQRALDIIGARIELAEATGNRAAEIAARKARIKALQDEIRASHGDTLKILQLRTEIANERKALKELQGEVAQRNQAFKELSFEFLQAQQGFAANLLGNLIPGFATQGLVGGGPAPAAAEGAFRVPAEAVKPPQTGIGIEAGLAAARGGVTQGQFSALLDLTRQIVRLLGGNAAARGAPEAWNQRQLEMAAMDSIPSGGGV